MSDKLFKPSDLLWAIGWLCKKTFYTVAPLPLLFLIAGLKGRLKSYRSQARVLTYKNLAAVFGRMKSEKEIRAIVRRHFEYAEKNELTYFLPRLEPFAKPDCWPVEGLEFLDSALALGKGAILLSAHFGYARVIKPAISLRGYPVTIVGPRAGARFRQSYKQAREQKRQTLTRFGKFMHQRLQISNAAYAVNDLAASLNVRPLVELLRKNEILFIQGDGLHSANLVNVEVLGQPIPFPEGVMSLALKTGTAILPAFAVDTPSGLGIRTIIEKRLELPTNGTEREVVIRYVECFAHVFESYLNRYPHLYRWSRENWLEKRRARGMRKVEQRYSVQQRA